jgi:hypothetical protein
LSSLQDHFPSHYRSDRARTHPGSSHSHSTTLHPIHQQGSDYVTAATSTTRTPTYAHLSADRRSPPPTSSLFGFPPRSEPSPPYRTSRSKRECDARAGHALRQHAAGAACFDRIQLRWRRTRVLPVCARCTHVGIPRLDTSTSAPANEVPVATLTFALAARAVRVAALEAALAAAGFLAFADASMLTVNRPTAPAAWFALSSPSAWILPSAGAPILVAPSGAPLSPLHARAYSGQSRHGVDGARGPSWRSDMSLISRFRASSHFVRRIKYTSLI